LGITADVTGIFAAIFALFAWIQATLNHKYIKEAERLSNEKVSLVIRVRGGNDEIRLPSKIRRADLNRQEILGRIGMIPMKEPQVRFALKYLNDSEFFDQLDKIHSGTDSVEIIVYCDDEELNQFDRNTTTAG